MPEAQAEQQPPLADTPELVTINSEVTNDLKASAEAISRRPPSSPSHDPERAAACIAPAQVLDGPSAELQNA